jgi:hypothetical protein
MIRTLIFMGLMAINMLIASGCALFVCIEPGPLDRTVRETLNLVKKEVRSTIILTTEKVKCNEMDFHAGNEIIDSLTETIKQMDTLIAASVQLGKTGNKEEIILFAERTNLVIMSALTNLKSLRDLYDISTYSQFETATFFPADSFSIPSEKIDEAKKAIEPVAQRIVRFFADHPRQKFEAVIACSSTPGSQDPNIKLCELRALFVANLLVDQIRSKEEFIPNPEWIHYNIKWVGEGEALPYHGRRKHHKPEDKRRSIVSLIWNLLPASLYAGASDH